MYPNYPNHYKCQLTTKGPDHFLPACPYKLCVYAPNLPEPLQVSTNH